MRVTWNTIAPSGERPPDKPSSSSKSGDDHKFWKAYHHSRREQAQREALVNAYRKGSLDSASIQLALLRTIVSEPPPSLAARRKHLEAQNGFMPTSLTDMASRYPLASIFALGAAGGAVLAGASVLGSRLARRTLSSRARQAAEGQSASASTTTEKTTATQTVQASQGGNKSSSVPLVPCLPSSWGEAQTASKDVVLRLDRLEKTILDHVQASNRDRRVELDIFRKEILGSIASLKPASAVISTHGGNRPTGNGNGEVGATPGSPGFKQAKAEVKKPIIGVGEVEKKLRDLEDLVVLANRDRRVELQGFRSEILGRLGTVEDKIGEETKQDIAQILRSALDERFGVEAHSGLGSKLENKFAQVEKSVKALVDQVVQARDVQPVPPTLDQNALPVPLERDFEEAKKDSTVDDEAIPRDISGQYVLSPLTSSTQGQVKGRRQTEEDVSVHNAASNLTCTTIAGEGDKAEQLAQEDQMVASSLSAAADNGYTTVTEPNPTVSDECVPPAMAPIQDGSNGRLSRSQRRRRKFSTLVDPGPRIGIDDSGCWKFVLSLAPGEQIQGAGWRLADVVYEQSSCDSIASVFYAFSHSTGTEIYPDVKVFFYPEFNIVRLDGQLWRCERTERCTWTIREKIGDATEAEWDGAGYEKE